MSRIRPSKVCPVKDGSASLTKLAEANLNKKHSLALRKEM